MSNKKQPFVVKPPPAEPATQPPRYQPPPLPPAGGQGILKHSKDAHHNNKQHPKLPADAVKIPYPAAKPYPYYPSTTQVQIHQSGGRPLDEPGVPQVHPADPRLLRQPVVRYDEEFLRPEMLKFVRKPDPGDPNRHLQVGFYVGTRLILALTKSGTHKEK